MDLAIILSVIAFVLSIVSIVLFIAARKAIISLMDELDKQKKILILGREEGAEKSLEKAVKDLREMIEKKVGISKSATISELIQKIEESNLDRKTKKEIVFFFSKYMEVQYGGDKNKKDLLWLRNEAIRLTRILEY